AQVKLSHWIIIMTTLLALFLGFNKRRQELQMLQHDAAAHRHVLRKYSPYFIDQMVATITSSIVVTYLLYTVDSHTIAIFGSRKLLWSVPFVYYGIFRYLYLVHKIRREGDPTRMLLADRMMQVNIFLWLVSCVVAIYFE
ncbi:MAG: decaprenyl-phosphate phosphoribosyltransferase, partial [Nitrosomonas ureae]